MRKEENIMVISIGKAVLYQMLGIQESYYTPVHIPSECKSCPWIEAAMQNPSTSVIQRLNEKCALCQNKHSNCLKYINERNQYGKNEKIHRNAIQIFMLLHTYSPSSTGYTKNISIQALSSCLNISERTVKNCLKVLENKNYIFVDYMASGSFNAILLDYQKYFLKAEKGGRGYIKIPENILMKLLEIKNILTFRIILRQFLDTNNTDSIKTYNQLKRTLPAYCKRNVIIKALNSYTNTIYNIKTSISDVHFSLKTIFTPNIVIEQEKNNYISYFTHILQDLENFVWSSKPISMVPEHLKRFVINPVSGESISTPVLFQQNHTENILNDLAQLSITYSSDIVLDALADTYREKMCKSHSLIKNVGAYIKTVIKSYQSSTPNYF